jgi:glutamate-1-semialdehyde 2,1-aminomutase
MAAARANLLEVLTPAAYERLERLGRDLLAGCEQVVGEHALAARCDGIGAKGSVILDDPELAELAWLWGMNRGVFTTHGRPPEWTLSVAHGQDAVDRYLEVFAELAGAVTRRSSGSARA